VTSKVPPVGETPGDVIRSSSNRLVRFVRSLQRRSVRHTERAFVVEGERSVRDALASGALPLAVVIREGDSFEHLSDGVRPRIMAVDLYGTLCDTVHPQGILAVIPFPDYRIPMSAVPLYVVADRISDPGNLGTLLRSAAAAGVHSVFLSAGTVDQFNPKVVRAAMGAHFRVPIMNLTPDLVARIETECSLRVLADLGDFATPDDVDWRGPATLIVASETTGPSELAVALATNYVTIPMSGGMESLNAAVAGSVILFEAARQRRVSA